MRGSSAYYRLVDRPGLWTAVLIAILVATLGVPFWGSSVHEALETLNGLWTVGSHPDPAGRLLKTSLLLAFIVGTQVAGVSSRVRKTLFGWTLPALRRGLVAANLQIMAAGMVLTIAFHGGVSTLSFAAAGLAAVLYAVGLAVGWMTRWAGVLIILLVIPDWLSRPGVILTDVVAINPLLVGLAATAGATWIVLRGLSPELQRREIPGLEQASHKPGVVRRFVSWMLGRLFGRTKPTLVTPRPVRPGSLRDWLRALADTTYPSGMRWVGRLIRTAVFTVAIGYTFNVLFIVAMPLIGIVGRETSVLAGPYLYPLSRRLRATVLYIVTLKAVAFLAVSGLLAMALLAWKPWPQFGFGGTSMTPTQALLRTGIALALIPFLQWQASAPPLSYFWLSAMSGSPERTARFLRLVVLAALYLALTAIWEAKIGPSLSALGALVIAGAVVAMQLLLFVALKWAYQTRDLV